LRHGLSPAQRCCGIAATAGTSLMRPPVTQKRKLCGWRQAVIRDTKVCAGTRPQTGALCPASALLGNRQCGAFGTRVFSGQNAAPISFPSTAKISWHVNAPNSVFRLRSTHIVVAASSSRTHAHSERGGRGSPRCPPVWGAMVITGKLGTMYFRRLSKVWRCFGPLAPSNTT
jgi:hypothetical protein